MSMRVLFCFCIWLITAVRMLPLEATVIICAAAILVMLWKISDQIERFRK